MVNMDADWHLPPPISSKGNRLKSVSTDRGTESIASTFSTLAAAVVAEAVRRAQSLTTDCDAEGFHQLRVAFRKLRALYWAYAPYLGEETTAYATEEFKRLAAVAGETRDWDIAGDLLQAAQESRASMRILVAAAKEKRAQAVTDSRKKIKSDAVESFLKEVLREAQVRLQSNCEGLPVREFAENRVRRAERALKKCCRYASRNEPAHEEDLHEVRKAGKKLRYLLEFFQPVIEGGHHRTIKELTSVQNKLGQFNDIAASESLIRGATFEDVPPEVVQESLEWLVKQKNRRMRAAARRVKALTS